MRAFKVLRVCLGVITIAGLVLLAIACDDAKDEETFERIEPTTAVFAPAAPEADPREATVTVYDDRVEPRQLNITASAPVQFRVVNRSRTPCTFFLGEYLSGLRVPAGGEDRMSFTAPEDRSGDTARMGCEGDPARQGTAVIEFKGVLPGPGR